MGDFCPICFEKYDGDVFVLDCGHVFHEKCLCMYVKYRRQIIKELRQLSYTCPLCKERINICILKRLVNSHLYTLKHEQKVVVVQIRKLEYTNFWSRFCFQFKFWMHSNKHFSDFMNNEDDRIFKLLELDNNRHKLQQEIADMEELLYAL